MSEPQVNNVIIKDMSASAGPLGLSAFGICTVLLSSTNAGLIPFDSVVLSMGLFYGGLTQIIVGILEGKKGNTFGLMAFTSYGIFWVSFVALNILPGMGAMPAPSGSSINAFLIVWCAFTIVLFVATLKLPKFLQVLFGALVVLFVLLIVGSITGSAGITTMAGYEGIVVGLISFYGAAAFLLNEVYNRTVLPVG